MCRYCGDRHHKAGSEHFFKVGERHGGGFVREADEAFGRKKRKHRGMRY